MFREAIAASAAIIVAACSPGVPGQQLESSQPTTAESTVRLRRVRLSTGVQLQVAETGPANGEPVVFLHGYTDSWFSYTRVLEQLPEGVRAIVPSQRGHGDSERPACCYKPADFAADAVALLDALGIARAHVVGHSMGSFIAQRIAIDYPERVNRLVLIGSGTTVRTSVVTEFSQVVQSLTDPVAPEFVREFQQSTLAVPVPQTFFDAVVEESQKLPSRVWRDVLTGLIAPETKFESERIRAKTLIVWGEKDAFWSRSEQDSLLSAIPDARLITYPDIGHAPHWEQPGRFVADLQDFLDLNVAKEAAQGRGQVGTSNANRGAL